MHKVDNLLAFTTQFTDAEYNMVIHEVDVPIVDFETCQGWYMKVRVSCEICPQIYFEQQLSHTKPS